MLQARNNLLSRIRLLAVKLGVRPAELLHMAREAAHWELMPGLEVLSNEAAESLYSDLLAIQESRAWMNNLSTQMSAIASR